MSNVLTLTIDLDQHELVESNHEKYGQCFFLNSKAGRFVKVVAKDEEGNTWSLGTVQFKPKSTEVKPQKSKTAAPSITALEEKLDKVLQLAISNSQSNTALKQEIESIKANSIKGKRDGKPVIPSIGSNGKV